MPSRFLYRTATVAFLTAAVSGVSAMHPAHAQSGDDVLSREQVWRDPEVPVLGNPDGDVTIVEYFDYQCPICKLLHPQLAKAIRQDGKVRLVSKSWPIFGEASSYAARIALATKYQGKFPQSHEALFTAKKPLTKPVIQDLLSKAGIDVPRAIRDLEANRAAIEDTLKRNQIQAVAFGFLGTPAFIVGTFRVEGGLDAEGFKQVIGDARKAQAKR